jgi:hypothetical protein
VSLNTTTQGNWRGVYGSQGVNIAGVGNTLPGSAVISTTGISYTWAASTTLVQAPQNLTGTGRTAAEWYGGTTFDFNLNLTDGGTHQVALYLLDFDNQNRQEKVQVLNASTSAQLAAVTVYPFSGGAYALFNVSGSVIFRITKLSGGGPVLTGVFLDPVFTAAAKAATASVATPTAAPVKAPTLTGAGLTFSAVAGHAISDVQIGSFSSASKSVKAANFTVTIDWGDGTGFSKASLVYNASTKHFRISGSHKYLAKGKHDILIDIVGTDGSTLELGAVAKVN